MEIFSGCFGPVETNSYLLVDQTSHKAVWIDPAPGSSSLLMHLPQNVELDRIILTHSHWDHIAEIGHSSALTIQPQVLVHTLDQPNLLTPGADGLGWPDSISKPKLSLVHSFETASSIPSFWQLGAYTFEIFHTPGHSPGSCSFYCQELKLLFSGDTLFASGFGRVDFPQSSPKAMKHSLQQLALLPGEVKLLAGHGPQAYLHEITWLQKRFKD